MALNADTIFEVWSTGSDNNGGGFVTGASGTDRSQQAAAHTNGTNLTVDGTDNTLVVPDGHTPVAADIGNLIQITAGTGFTTGFYEIIGQDGTNWDLDRSPAAVSTAGGTWAMGGALATINKATGVMVSDGMMCYVKATATYSISSTLVSGPANGSFVINKVMGYTTTRGDNGRVTVQATAAIIMLQCDAGREWEWHNFLLDGNADTATTGVVVGVDANIFNIKVQDINGTGIDAGSRSKVNDCEVTGCVIGVDSGAAVLRRVWSHDNSSHGFYDGNGSNGRLTQCVSSNNGGDGFVSGYYTTSYVNCVAYGNTGDGFEFSYNIPLSGGMENCIAVNNGGYGLRGNAVTQSLAKDYFYVNHNAFYNNTSGARINVNAGPDDVTLTGDPFVDAANDDFRLNNAAGAGAACRENGGSLIGFPTKLDIGAYQHNEPRTVMNGGMQ